MRWGGYWGALGGVKGRGQEGCRRGRSPAVRADDGSRSGIRTNLYLNSMPIDVRPLCGLFPHARKAGLRSYGKGWLAVRTKPARRRRLARDGGGATTVAPEPSCPLALAEPPARAADGIVGEPLGTPTGGGRWAAPWGIAQLRGL